MVIGISSFLEKSYPAKKDRDVVILHLLCRYKIQDFLIHYNRVYVLDVRFPFCCSMISHVSNMTKERLTAIMIDICSLPLLIESQISRVESTTTMVLSSCAQKFLERNRTDKDLAV